MSSSQNIAMAKKLKKADMVALIQQSLPGGKIVTAHFSRKRKYSYYIFDSTNDLVDYLKDLKADYLELDEKDKSKITFSIDEWLLFSSVSMAFSVLSAIKPHFSTDD